MEQLFSLLSAVATGGTDVQLDQELCLTLRLAVLSVVGAAAVAVLFVLFASRRKEKIHVLDFAVHKPNERSVV